ncbi:MAG: CHAT domain-containing protein [Cyanobacteria bacterium J06627_28]
MSFAYALSLAAQAQTVIPSITAADDRTGTVIDHAGDIYTIEGGSFSADGANQFHRFEQFDLAPAATANFVVPATVSSVIGRINSDQASLIHGTLTISGAATSPHLYLLNPAGILFGDSARLNLPGNFTATTANGIGFGLGDRQRWLSAADNASPVSYSQFVGSPTAFTFSSVLPGGIVNQANLQLRPQQEALFLGGLVANTGSIRALGGHVTLAAVPSNTLVRLSQPGQLLSYEVLVDATYGLSHPSQADYAWLSAVLSQTEGANALITNADGTVSLQNSAVPLSVEAGHVIASGNVSVSDINTANGVGGNIFVLGDRVSVLQATLAATGQSQGGQIRVGGDFQGQGNLPTADQTLIDQASALIADGLGDIVGIGNGGRVIVWADRATGFWGSASANAGAQGGDGGFVEISGKERLIFQGDVSLESSYGNSGTLLLDPLDIIIVDGFSAPDDVEVIDFAVNDSDGGSGTFVISEGQLETLSGGFNLRLEATRDIIIQDLSDDLLSFPFGFNTITLLADADNNGIGNVVMNDFNDTLETNSSDINIIGETLDLGNIVTGDVFGVDAPGSVQLSAADQVAVGNIDTHAGIMTPGIGGDVLIEAQNEIFTGDIITEGDAAGGNVFIASNSTPPITGIISTLSAFGFDGDITLLPTTPDLPDIFDGFFDPDFGFDFEFDFEEELDQLDSGADDVALGNLNDAPGGIAIPSDEIVGLEQINLGELSDYFGRSLAEETLDVEEVQQLLFDVAEQLEVRTAVVSVHVVDSNVNTGEGGADEQLELIVLLPGTAPQKFIVAGVDPRELKQTANEFRNNLLTSVRRRNDSFMPQSQALYQALIAPLEETLDQANIDTLVFSMASGLRMVPLAALHDGEQYLIEKYGVGMVPSLSLIDPQFDQPIDSARVLAMGASSFDTLSPLPGVPVEVEMIRNRWPGATFLNEDFTREAMLEQRSQVPYELIHLATHAEFNAGDIDNSYIQLWDSKLRLSELSELGWDSPAVDLLVLSACRTAVGSSEAEMGFAGLAVGSGVRTAMASIWAVSDLGTLALMGEFYSQLNRQPIKAEALRAAQLSMLYQQTEIVDGQLVTPTGNSTPLPDDLTANIQPDLSHPYYWSGFTMIGSPW